MDDHTTYFNNAALFGTDMASQVIESTPSVQNRGAWGLLLPADSVQSGKGLCQCQCGVALSDKSLSMGTRTGVVESR